MFGAPVLAGYRLSGEPEGGGIREAAHDGRLVRRQGSHLEVAPPRCFRGFDAVILRGLEPESGVVGGFTHQANQGLLESISGTQDGVHQGMTHTDALMVGVDTQWRETEHGATQCTERGATADDVTDHVGSFDCDKRELWNPRFGRPKILDQGRFRRLFGWRLKTLKRQGMDATDCFFITGLLSPDQHLVSLARSPIEAL